MKALSLTQPWAQLVALGAKKIETRSWRTSFTGEFAIHASAGFPKWAKDLCTDEPEFSYALQSAGSESPKDLPTGAIVAVADLSKCLRTDESYYLMAGFDIKISGGRATGNVTQVDYRKPAEGTPEFQFGDYSYGRFMFFLENVVVLPSPINCKGALGFWSVPTDIEAQIRSQLNK
jgi:hypothetical protein